MVPRPFLYGRGPYRKGLGTKLGQVCFGASLVELEVALEEDISLEEFFFLLFPSFKSLLASLH